MSIAGRTKTHVAFSQTVAVHNTNVVVERRNRARFALEVSVRESDAHIRRQDSVISSPGLINYHTVTGVLIELFLICNYTLFE